MGDLLKTHSLTAHWRDADQHRVRPEGQCGPCCRAHHQWHAWGPEGLVFIPASDSPNGKPLLLVGYEVSGSTAVIQLNLAY
jgi:hypothetical protein